MTDMTSTPISLSETPRFPKLWGALKRVFSIAPRAEVTPEEARARTEFVQDMLCANPDAFASELDVQCMLHHFPGRF